jgi:hypothetical protein
MEVLSRGAVGGNGRPLQRIISAFPHVNIVSEVESGSLLTEAAKAGFQLCRP